MKTPQFKEVSFKKTINFKTWLKATTFKKVNLEDKGQDMQNVFIHSTGEILHCDFHAGIYNGKFVNLNALGEGQALEIYNHIDGTFSPLNGLIINKVTES